MNKFMMIIFTFLFFTSFNLLASKISIHYYTGQGHHGFDRGLYDIEANDYYHLQDIPYYVCALEFGTKMLAYNVGWEFENVEVQEDKETKSEYLSDDPIWIFNDDCEKGDRFQRIPQKNLSDVREKIITVFEIGQITGYIGKSISVQIKNTKKSIFNNSCHLEKGSKVKILKLADPDDSLRITVEIIEQIVTESTINSTCPKGQKILLKLDDLHLETQREFL